MRKSALVLIVLIVGSCLVSACNYGISQPKLDDSDYEQLNQHADSDDINQAPPSTESPEAQPGTETEADPSSGANVDDTGSSTVDMNQFIGTFTELSSNEYKKSEIVIKQVSEQLIVLDLEAFVVRGGAEGLENGNISIGNLHDAKAIIDGTTAIYKDESMAYEMTIEFAADGTFTVTEQGDSPYGHGVSASGQYGVMQ